MKITIVTGAFVPLPPAGCGAVERCWHGLATEFAVRGHEVTMLACAHPTQPNDEIVQGVRYIRRGRLRQTSRLAINLMKDCVYALRIVHNLPPADILVCNDLCTGMLAPRLSQRYGKIVINVARMPRWYLRRALYARADRLAVVSSAVSESMRQIAPELSGRVRVICNPIYTNVLIPPPKPRRYEGRQTILYTGRIHPEKGLHLLVDAFARIYRDFPHLCLKLVGPTDVAAGGGGMPYVDSLKKKANGLPVEFHKPVYDMCELARILQAAHYYCYPSLAEKGETFGVAPLEAAATGLPVLVSNLACFREFVEDERTGFVFDHRCTDSAGALAETLRKVSNCPELRERVCRAAVQEARAFSYENVASAYLKDFEVLLGEDRGRAQQAEQVRAAA